MSHIGDPLPHSKAFALINDALDSNPRQKRLCQWKKIHTYGVTEEDLGQVGYKYWINFKKRNADKIVTRKGEKFELDSYNWTAYHNFAQMYKCFVDEMKYTMVAKKLPKSV